MRPSFFEYIVMHITWENVRIVDTLLKQHAYCIFVSCFRLAVIARM